MTANVLNSTIESVNGRSISLNFSLATPAQTLLARQLTIEIARIETVREPIVAVTTGNLSADGSFNARFDLEDGLYAIVAATVSSPEAADPPEELLLTGDVSFSMPGICDVQGAIASVREKRIEMANSPILAEGAASDSISHTLITFFSGVKLHAPQIMEGLWVVPVQGELATEDLRAVLTRFLRERLNRPFEVTQEAQAEYARSHPIFCVVVPNIKADTMEAALHTGQSISLAVLDILTIERGERPRKIANYYSDGRGESFWFDVPAYRGNYLAPLFEHEQAAFIERWLPLMQQNGVASLYVNLLAAAVGERNLAYQHFRYWALIEQIAKNKVADDTLPLSHADGSPMMANGQVQVTHGALRKVYYYLYAENIGTWDVSFKDLDDNDILIAGVHSVGPFATGTTVLAFFEGLEAAYELRNQVAHRGHFHTTGNPTPREARAAGLRSNFLFNSWFRDIVKTAVFSELQKISSNQ
ncbi:hypothetical protein ACI2J5_11670 [Agrobacterium pusense]|uniref:hypothetical protein n=1 Tax=Agrobacterium pusense TaxID=648995 RepID=UPI00384BAC13